MTAGSSARSRDGQEKPEQCNRRDRVHRVDDGNDDRGDGSATRRDHGERQCDHQAVPDREDGEQHVLVQVRVDLVLVLGDPRPPHPRVRVVPQSVAQNGVRRHGKVQERDGTVLVQ